ncbi:MAG: hypothetical protein EXR95_10885, partial [Gemmatimonadetes bacterium]|nr:hypothetical protein [Gemmatimonadota bacterium]
MNLRPTLTLTALLACTACAKQDAPPAEAAVDPMAEISVKDVGLMTPESVLHDSVADVYLVSN